MLYSVFRQMVRFPKYILTKTGTMGLVLTLGLVIGGCATNAPEKPVVEPTTEAVPMVIPKQSSKPPETKEPVKEPVTAQPDGEVTGKEPSVSGETVNVSVYTIDDQCNDFVEKTVQLPSDNAMTEAVGQAMNATDYVAFKLEGYQVSVNGTTAVVDMKLAPGSERKFVSLSSCEQRALFGSVEKTLLNNPSWDIKAVKFTSRGEEIAL